MDGKDTADENLYGKDYPGQVKGNGEVAQLTVYCKEAQVLEVGKHTSRVLAQHVWPAHQHGARAKMGGKGTANVSLYGKD